MQRQRARLVRQERVEGWHDLRPELQQRYPRVTVLTDELNTLLLKGGSSKTLETLRRDIGLLIGALLFGGRKYGIHVVVCGQIIYAQSFMANGAYAQCGAGVAVGALPGAHQKMVSNLSGNEWPKVPNRAGYGATFTYAEAVKPLRLPALPAFVAERLADDLLARAAS